MKLFDYTSLEVTWDPARGFVYTEADPSGATSALPLDEMGSYGWELVQIAPVEMRGRYASQGRLGWVATFKRERNQG